jgi:hypothetical protein
MDTDSETEELPSELLELILEDAEPQSTDLADLNTFGAPLALGTARYAVVITSLGDAVAVRTADGPAAPVLEGGAPVPPSYLAKLTDTFKNVGGVGCAVIVTTGQRATLDGVAWYTANPELDVGAVPVVKLETLRYSGGATAVEVRRACIALAKVHREQQKRRETDATRVVADYRALRDASKTSQKRADARLCKDIDYLERCNQDDIPAEARASISENLFRRRILLFRLRSLRMQEMRSQIVNLTGAICVHRTISDVAYEATDMTGIQIPP